jgi:hypothetical protein
MYPVAYLCVLGQMNDGGLGFHVFGFENDCNVCVGQIGKIHRVELLKVQKHFLSQISLQHISEKGYETT